jgi:hypothetical protein
MRSVARLHKESSLHCEFCGLKPVKLWSCSEIGDSQLGREGVNTEVEVSTAFEAFTTQRLVKIQQT